MDCSRRTDELKYLLLIDGDPSTRSNLNRIFSKDYFIIETENSAQALEVIHGGADVSAIIFNPPQSDTPDYSTMAELAADSQASAIPVIIVSSCGNVLQADIDDVSGLLNKYAFLRRASQLLQKNRDKHYVLMRWDIDNYKVYNDTFGTEAGDDFLHQIGQFYLMHQQEIPGLQLVGRYEADHFICLREADSFDPEKSAVTIQEELYRLKVRPFDFVPRIGLYHVDDPDLNVSLMCDRALLALKSVKFNYNKSYAWYSDAMRKKLLQEQSIVASMESALTNEEFKVFLQPQYDHGTGEPTGAEALVRWLRPDGSVTPPDVFISTFEKNGFIYELDKYMWEHVCRLLRRWLDMGLSPAPISVNVSRHDVMYDTFLPTLIGYVEKYDLPTQLLRLEITESAFSKDTEHLVAIVTKLRDYGFTIEIDDFGSGYSSFNTLKDVPADVLKIDMRFLQGKDNLQRGGNILESIVRMTSWLGMQVIAEGVETKQQADFLHSIGCSHVQGYLYAKPMPVDDYERLMTHSKTAPVSAAITSVKGMDADAFWNPESLDALIFSSYVGGACVMEYKDDQLFMIRVNDSFREALRLVNPANKLMGFDLFTTQPQETAAILKAQIHECATIGTTISGVNPVRVTCDFEPHTEYLRYTIHMIAKTGNRLMLYALAENVTKQTLLEQQDREKTNQLRLLNDISSDLLSEPDADKAISNVLHKLIGYLGCSRAYVAELDTHKQTIVTTYEAVPDGSCHNAPGISCRHPLQAFSYWMNVLKQNGHVSIDIKGDLSATEQEILKQMAASSLIAVPIMRDGQLIGMLGSTDPHISTDHVEHLMTLGDYMAVILTRRDLNAKIEFDNAALLNMMNDMPGGFARMRIYPDGLIVPVFINDAFCRIFGMSHEDAMVLYGHDAFAGVHPDDQAHTMKLVSELVADGDATALTVRLAHKDGGSVAVRTFYRITKDEHGDHYLNGYYVNMDSEYKAEHRRRELLDNLPVAMIAYDMNGQTQPVYINRSAYRLFGYTPDNRLDDSRGSPPAAFIPAEISNPRTLIELLGQNQRMELPHILAKRKDGSSFWLSFVLHRVKHGDENPMVYVILNDVTDKVTTAQELKTRRAELSTINDSIPGGICRYAYDTDDQFSFVSDALLQMLGYSQDEFSTEFHNRFSEFIYWEDREQALAVINSNLSGSDTSNGDTYRVQTKSGALKWLLSTSRLITTEPGQRQVVCIMLDIDHQRKLEESLRLEQNKIATLLATLPGGIACYRYEDWTMSLEYANDGLYALLGFSPDELFGSDAQPRRSLLHPDDVQQLSAARNVSLQTGYPLKVQYRHLTKNGKYIWIHMDARFILEKPGTGMMYAFYTDITELKKDQSGDVPQLPPIDILLGRTLGGATGFSSTDLQNILNLIPGGFSTFVIDDDRIDRTFISDGALKALGYSSMESVPDDAVNTLGRVHPDDRAALKAKISEAIKNVRVFNMDMRIISAPGMLHWVNLTANPVVINDGKLHYFGIYTDVTERHLAEERRLARYHRELQYLTAVNSDGLLGKMRINLTTGEIEHVWLQEGSFSSSAAQNYAVFCKEVCHTVITAEQRDELATMMNSRQLLKEHAKGNTEFRLEYQRRNLSGRVIWVATTVKTYTGSVSGNVKAFLYTYDIDEKKTLSILVNRLLMLNMDLLGLIDVNTGNLHFYYYRNKQKAVTVQPDVDYGTSYERYVQYCVADADKVEAIEAFRLESILSHLTDVNATRVVSFWTFTDGEQYRKQWIYSWLDDSMTTVVICRMDVTVAFHQQEEHQAALKLVQQESEKARLDSATGILNHSATEEEISNRLFATANGYCALLLLDLDDLKAINDLYGHPSGDTALLGIAQTLKCFFRNGDVVGRIGGDEFMVFLDNVQDEETFRPALHRLLNELQKVRTGQHNEHAIHCSVGCVIGDYRTASFASLYKQADIALYHVKRNGKNGFAFYTPRMETATYDYEGQKIESLKRSELLNTKELRTLLNAISVLYPMIIYVNLSQNSYDMLAYNSCAAQTCMESGSYDDLIAQGAACFIKDDQPSFIETFSRQTLLKAYVAGERHLSHAGRLIEHDGVHCFMQIDIILLPSPLDGDVYALALARPIQRDNAAPLP